MIETHMLWVKGNLGNLEHLSVSSFLVQGYSVNLWTYGELSNAPLNTRIRDARDILPESSVFLNKRGSYASFSDLFRYTVLSSLGGLWADTDVIALIPPSRILAKQFVVTERAAPPLAFKDRAKTILKRSLGASPPTVVNNNVIYNPNPSAGNLIDLARVVAERFPKSEVVFDELGPRLLTALVRYHHNNRFAIMPPEFANSVDWWDCPRILLSPATSLNPGACFLHCYNEMWMRAGIDKNAPFPDGSILAMLAARANS